MLVRLLSSILSKPMKLDCAAVRRAPAKIVMEAIMIRNEASGLWNTVKAMKFDRETKITVKTSPVAASKSRPETTISYACSSLFSARALATYLVMAELTPQSLKRIAMYEGTSAIEYSPYSSGVINLARIIVPIAIMMVDVATPMNN